MRTRNHFTCELSASVKKKKFKNDKEHSASLCSIVFDQVYRRKVRKTMLAYNMGGGHIIARDSIYAIARICYRNSVCLAVWPSVRHTGGLYKNG